ncbi:MAG: glycosyltransferase [Candidatus Lernaella stagnicola]|nr:glycosyltransferase [Candidatus Lernaella stagnicola]
MARLTRLPGFEFHKTPQGAIDLAVTDDPAMVGELAAGFVGKLPLWLDLDGHPNTVLRMKSRHWRELSRATMITVATRGMWEAVREFHHDVYLVPDPVEETPPARVAELPLLRPAIGFAGEYNPWCNIDFLPEMAALRRDQQIYVAGEAGRQRRSREAAARLPNFHILAEAEAALWRRFSVAVFPYAVDKPTEYWLPYELPAALSAGALVVATPLTELARGDLPISLASRPAGFAARVAELLADAAAAAALRRRGREAAAAEHAPSVVAERLRAAMASTGLD